jgi:hypothetical protein
MQLDSNLFTDYLSIIRYLHTYDYGDLSSIMKSWDIIPLMHCVGTNRSKYSTVKEWDSFYNNRTVAIIVMDCAMT